MRSHDAGLPNSASRSVCVGSEVLSYDGVGTERSVSGGAASAAAALLEYSAGVLLSNLECTAARLKPHFAGA